MFMIKTVTVSKDSNLLCGTMKPLISRKNSYCDSF